MVSTNFVTIYCYNQYGMFIDKDIAQLDADGNPYMPSNATLIAIPNMIDSQFAVFVNDQWVIYTKNQLGKFFNKQDPLNVINIEIDHLSALPDSIDLTHYTQIAPTLILNNYTIFDDISQTWIYTDALLSNITSIIYRGSSIDIVNLIITTPYQDSITINKDAYPILFDKLLHHPLTQNKIFTDTKQLLLNNALRRMQDCKYLYINIDLPNALTQFTSHFETLTIDNTDYKVLPIQVGINFADNVLSIQLLTECINMANAIIQNNKSQKIIEFEGRSFNSAYQKTIYIYDIPFIKIDIPAGDHSHTTYSVNDTINIHTLNGLILLFNAIRIDIQHHLNQNYDRYMQYNTNIAAVSNNSHAVSAMMAISEPQFASLGTLGDVTQYSLTNLTI